MAPKDLCAPECPEPVTETLREKGFCRCDKVNDLEIGDFSGLSRWALTEITCIRVRRRRGETSGRRRGGPENTGLRLELMRPQAQWTPGATRSWKRQEGASLWASRGIKALLTPWFQTSGLQTVRTNCCHFTPPRLRCFVTAAPES